MFKLGRAAECAGKQVLAAGGDYDDAVGQDNGPVMGDAIGSFIQATMFGLIRTFDDAAYDAHEAADHRERRR